MSVPAGTVNKTHHDWLPPSALITARYTTVVWSSRTPTQASCPSTMSFTCSGVAIMAW